MTAAFPIYTQLSLLNLLGTDSLLLKNLRPHRKRPAADVTDQKHREPLLAARGVRREGNFPQEVSQPSDQDHILIYVTGQKPLCGFQFKNPRQAKVSPLVLATRTADQ